MPVCIGLINFGADGRRQDDVRPDSYSVDGAGSWMPQGEAASKEKAGWRETSVGAVHIRVVRGSR